MKMADGGFSPAYNVQFATATESQVIVGVDVETNGSDQGQMGPMVEQIRDRYDTRARAMLVDGGFAQARRHRRGQRPGVGCTVYAPVQKPKDPQGGSPRPEAGRQRAVAAWRQRMGTDAGQDDLQGAGGDGRMCECAGAGPRAGAVAGAGRGQGQAIALWHALAHNVLRGVALRAAAAQPT